MKDPLQIDITPYEILEVDQYADRKIIQNAYMRKLQTKAGKNATQARKTLLSPIRRAYVDIFMFSPTYLKSLLPKIREPQHLTGKRQDVAAMWNKSEINEFPSIKATHSLAVLWYWWARYITESERIEKTETVSTIHSVQDLATDYSLHQLWENTVSRWVMLLNSDEFISSFEFTKDLDEAEKEQLKKDIYQHFTGLFAEYSYNYQKAGLQKESEDFSNFALIFKSEYEAARLLSKTKGIMPYGYSCGRLFLTNINQYKKAQDSLNKGSEDLTEEELRELTLMLSNDFYKVPTLFNEKQYSTCDKAIRDAISSKGISTSPMKWLETIEILPDAEKAQMQIAIEYFAKTCFHLGQEYAATGDIDKACEMFNLARKIKSNFIKTDDVSDALISFLEAKAGHNADLALFFIDKILKQFNYNKLYDYKAEILKEKSANLSQKIVSKVNALKSPSRDDLIKVTESYREVISLDKQAVAAAKSEDAIKAAKTKLVNDLLDNHLMMTNAIVANVASQLNDVVANAQKQIGYSMSITTAISRMINTPTMINALKGANIYYEKDQMVFLHALYEMRYCTALLGKYAFDKNDMALLGGIKALRDMGINQVGGRDITNILNSKKLYKYNDEAYWKKSTENFLMFTNITSSNIRYSIYVKYREGEYEGALRDYQKSFNVGYGVNKREYEFYKEAETNAKINEQCERVKFIEQSAYQTNAGINVALDAVEQYKKISSSGKATGVLADTRNESLQKLANVIESLLKKELDKKELDKSQLKSIVDLTERIQKEKIKISDLDEIIKRCASKLFDILVSDLSTKSSKVQSQIEKYLKSSSHRSNNSIIGYINEIEEDYSEIERLVAKYSLNEEILKRCKSISKQISELAERYYDAYAQKCYRFIEKIISKSEISPDEIQEVDTEARQCKRIIDDYCSKSSTSKNPQLAAASKNFKQIIKYQELEYYAQTLDVRKEYNKGINVYLSKDYLSAAEIFRIILGRARGSKFANMIRGYISDCYIGILLKSIEKAQSILDNAVANIQGFGTSSRSKILEEAKEFHNIMNAVSRQKTVVIENSDKSKETLSKISACEKAIKDLYNKYNSSILILSQQEEYDIYNILNDALNSNDYTKAIDEYNRYSQTKKQSYAVVENLYAKLLAKAMDEYIEVMKKQDEKYKQKRIVYTQKHQAELLDSIKLATKINNDGITWLFFLTLGLSIYLSIAVKWYLGIIAFFAIIGIVGNLLTSKCSYKGCNRKVEETEKYSHIIKYKKKGKEKGMILYLCSEHMEKVKNFQKKMPMPDDLKQQKRKILEYADKAYGIDRSFNKSKYTNVVNKIAGKYIES